MFLKMKLTVLSLFIISIKYKVLATDICTYQDPCKCVKDNNKIIDLSTVGLLNQPRFYEVELEDNTAQDNKMQNHTTTKITQLYSYNPCYPFDGDKHAKKYGDRTPCSKAAACIKVPANSHGDPPEEYAIGLQQYARFGFQNGLYINYTVPDNKKVLTVILLCDDTIEHDIGYVNNSDEQLVLSLTSRCACDDLCKSSSQPEPAGLSTGSKLLIAFFTILLAYLVIGLIWNFCNGAKGVELVPNLAFWNELPKLIMEGVVFTCSCFSGRRSYGEV